MTALAYDAGATKLAGLLGLDLRYTPKSRQTWEPLTAPCRCLGATGSHDPRVWSSAPGLCDKCGHWLTDSIGDVRPRSDLDGLADLADAVEDVRLGLLDEAVEDGIVTEEDYVHWLETRIAATERSLERMCRPRG